MDNQRQTNNKNKLHNVLTFIVLIAIVSGCRTGLDVSKLRGAEKSQFEAAEEGTEKKGRFSRLKRPFSSISQASFLKSSNSSGMEPLPSSAGYKELEAAQALLKDGEHKKAERAFKTIAKKYKDSSVAEDALFYRAESFYQRERYSYAQDGYTELMKAYPSTRYMRKSTQRLFDLSRHWLGFSEIVTSTDIQQANFENLKKTDPVKHTEPSPKGFTRTIPIFPNLMDKTRPIFDTEGRATEALKAIWLNDPTGPLADDALMLTASYYLRKNNIQEADHYLTILREEYPKSPHLENAFQLGSHAKLVSYQGPLYEGKSLDEAKKLKESTLRIFPDAKNKERILDDIRKIEHAHAERDWKMIEVYQKKKRPQSVIIYCNAIIDDYPHSEFATKAQLILNKIESDKLALNTNTKKRRRFQLRRRKKSADDDEPDFDDDLDSLKKEDSPARLKRILPNFTRKKKDEDDGEPEFMEESDDEIPEYDDPQFIDDDELNIPNDMDDTPNFDDDDDAPDRLEFEPGEDSDFIDLDEPVFDE